MAPESQAPFRQCFCRAPGCGGIFYICAHCDRGQVYCSSPCRDLARRLQCRAANLRHQRSEEGRLDHRDRQRAYRQRLSAARVTDHPSLTAPSYATLGADSIEEVDAPEDCWAWLIGAQSFVWPDQRGVVCRFCGRKGQFIDPFYELE